MQDRDRLVLQRVHDRAHRGPGALHLVLAEKLRGVQQCVEERQARPHRGRHRLRVDVGGHSRASRYITVKFPCSVSDVRVCATRRVVAIECRRV